ncbi:MAG: patatin-like phospholipase family protein, partial [Persicimonas sp.]
MSEADDSSIRRAIVLSGGGARGAYEAGVLRYILEEIPDDLGRPVRFDVISGTSVGAINAGWLAATIDRPTFCVQRLWYLWRTLSFERVVEP